MSTSSSPSKNLKRRSEKQETVTGEDFLPILRSLLRSLRQSNSLSLAFARGMMSGLGATVGVTFVLGILVLIISQVARLFGIEGWAQPFLERLSLS